MTKERALFILHQRCKNNTEAKEALEFLKKSVAQKSDEQLYKNGFADGYEQGHKDTEPKSGKWIATENGFECSECGCISRSRADFCQYCGAKMESEEQTE